MRELRLRWRRIRQVVSVFRAAYTNPFSVLLRLALVGKARAVTRDGRIVEGDRALLAAIARLYGLGLSDKVLDKFLHLLTFQDKGSQATASATTRELIEKLYQLKHDLRCCSLMEVSDDLSYIVIEIEGKRALIYGWHGILGPDYDDYYHILDVKGKSVLDVGAYVGESAILFALMGARRVVAVEPSPWAYSMARRNVEVNGLDNVIKLVNCAVFKEEGKVLMLPSGETGIGFKANEITSGDVPVPTCTLDSLIEKYGPFDVLKMDCEGCEYDSIPYSRRVGEVKEILIEYHQGYEPIVKKLREEGFKTVRYSRFALSMCNSLRELSPSPVDPWLGCIYATK